LVFLEGNGFSEFQTDLVPRESEQIVERDRDSEETKNGPIFRRRFGQQIFRRGFGRTRAEGREISVRIFCLDARKVRRGPEVGIGFDEESKGEVRLESNVICG